MKMMVCGLIRLVWSRGQSSCFTMPRPVVRPGDFSFGAQGVAYDPKGGTHRTDSAIPQPERIRQNQGPFAEIILSQLNVDKAFIGADSVDLARGAARAGFADRHLGPAGREAPMKALLEILDRELVFWDLDAGSDEAVIGFLAEQLIRKGIAKESFKAAVLERERTAPTGLQTERIGIAMPHVSEEHVNRKGLAVGFLKHPVRFRAMGMPEREVETRIVFMLALTDPHGHIDFLRELAAAFENSEILVAMADARDFGRLTELIRSMA